MQFQDNYPLSKVTTLQIGGPAKKFVTVSSKDELLNAIDYAKGENLEYLIIGGGSNLLVNDTGVNYLVIKNEVKGIEQNDLILKAKSGTLLQDLVNYSIENGLSGLQKLTGIPGTLGGAVYGNAGAYGQTISDHLVEVKAFNGREIITLTKDGCGFNYRDSIFKKNEQAPSPGSKFPILEVTFKLEHGNAKEMAKEAEETLSKRLVKYPKGIRCPGSFFKNIVAETLPKNLLSKIPPEKIVYGKLPAGSLLEDVGAKGDRLGDIEIAPYHANLFINKANGKAEDFYKLAQKYVRLVKEKFGITLEPEVQLINLPSLV